MGNVTEAVVSGVVNNLERVIIGNTVTILVTVIIL